MDWTKLEGFLEVMVEKTSSLRMVFYKRGCHWSTKERCSSRGVSTDGCIRARASILEEDIASIFLSRSIFTSVDSSEGSPLSMANTYKSMRVTVTSYLL